MSHCWRDSMGFARKKKSGKKAASTGKAAQKAGAPGGQVDFTVGEEGLLKALRSQVTGSEAGGKSAQKKQSQKNPRGASGGPPSKKASANRPISGSPPRSAAVPMGGGAAATAGDLLNSRDGSNRAARLLLALGPDQAATILKNLEPGEIEKLAVEMARIDHISADEKREILEYFDTVVKDFDEPVRGGLEQAKKILELSHGQDVAEEIIGRLSQRDLFRDFEFLERIEPPVLSAALSQEHTQIAAVALSFLKPRIAAAVMRNLPNEFRSEVAMRIAKTSRIHPEAVQRVARVLREKFEKRTAEIYSEIGGADTLANILNHMDRSEEDEILDVLGGAAPAIVEDVRERLYIFEELVNLDHREMRMLITEIGDDLLLAAGLRGAGEEIRRHFFNSMSQNRAADILEEMDRRGPLSVKEINEARSYVLTVARRLDEEGALVIKKEKDQYI
ncbi:MAG: flagellar motor switch protein FliG [bacterium]|nr:flagellar motor switch protein FliG [bacterium]